MNPTHCVKQRNFIKFPNVEISWKDSFHRVNDDCTETLPKLLSFNKMSTQGN